MPKYFAYGSNLYMPQVQERCPSMQALGKVYIQDYALSFPRLSKMWGGKGVASIIPEPQNIAHGFLYHLSEDDLLVMDRIEGTDSGAYIRERVTVHHTECPDLTRTECWTYFGVPQDGAPFFPSLKYINRIISGAEMHDLPKDYIETLKKWKKD